MLYQTTKTIASTPRDFPEWRRGRKLYAVWVLRCEENKAVQEKFMAAGKHLNRYLLKPYHRQPHITLFVCGFLVENHQYEDDFIPADLDAQIQALKKAKIAPFEIEIGGLNSFASAPFLDVHDPDRGIEGVREVLSNGRSEFRTEPYRPHLTVGLYSDAFVSREVLASMAGFLSEPVRWLVDQVTFATYRAEQCGGKLHYEYDFRLQSRP